MTNCLNCSDYLLKQGKQYCIKDGHKICLSCMLHDPASGCWIEKSEAEYQAHINSPEYKAKVAKEKAEEEAWLNRPKIKLRCKQCGTSQELGEEEYTDKRRRRKYESPSSSEPTSWCKKCHGFIEHEWEKKE